MTGLYKKDYPQGSLDYSFFVDFWQFYKMFGNTEFNDANYWQEVIECSDKLAEKYKGTEIEQMVKEVLMARLRHLERTAGANVKKNT